LLGRQRIGLPDVPMAARRGEIVGTSILPRLWHVQNQWAALSFSGWGLFGRSFGVRRGIPSGSFDRQPEAGRDAIIAHEQEFPE